jgi:hypothetical protein
LAFLNINIEKSLEGAVAPEIAPVEHGNSSIVTGILE